MMIGRTLLLGLTATVLAYGAANAAEVEIKMKNSGPDGPMSFDPSFVKIKPGDTVKFVAADKGHNAESIKGMAPEGAKTFKGDIGKDVTATFDKEGVYGVKCSPHYTMGMAALIAVGDKYPNLDAAKKTAKSNPAAQKRFEPHFAELGK